MTSEVKLTQGRCALIDDADLPLISRFKWYAVHTGCGRWYAATKPNGRVLYMHRLLMGLPTSKVDHRSGDGLDNRRLNLRNATHSQNLANQSKHRRNTSGYKGVVWNKQSRKWQASICRDSRLRHLGMFVDLIEAAKAYDAAAIKLFGDFANLNFPKAVSNA